MAGHQALTGEVAENSGEFVASASFEPEATFTAIQCCTNSDRISTPVHTTVPPTAYTTDYEYVFEPAYPGASLWDASRTNSYLDASMQLEGWHEGETSDTYAGLPAGGELISQGAALVTDDQYTMGYHTLAAHQYTPSDQSPEEGGAPIGYGDSAAYPHCPRSLKEPSLRKSKKVKWHEMPPQTDPVMEEKRKRAMKGRKNREKMRELEKTLKGTLETLTEEVLQLNLERQTLHDTTSILQSQLLIHSQRAPTHMHVPAILPDYNIK